MSQKQANPQSENYDPAVGGDVIEAEPAPLVLEEIAGLPNIAPELSPERLGSIGDDVVRDYELDRESMKDWLARMKAGIDLAMLVKETKNYPFNKAANVKYPLVTTAALQFNAKAYPAIVAADNVVKATVYGADPQGKKAARAKRVADHMSYDLDCNVEEWEEDTDNLLTMLPIVGTLVRKWWYDPAQGRKRCRLVDPDRFVVNNRTKHLADAPRMSELLPLYPGEIKQRRMTGEWLDQEYRMAEGEDKHAPEEFIEQHRPLDLDEDGFEEPYIVTVHKVSRKVARIVADYEAEDVTRNKDGKVLDVRGGTYFVAYKMLPAMDGGFFGTGLGLLLGDITEAINTNINLMLDAGHMQALGGGFIGSGFRIKGGSNRFSPGEWKTPNTAGSTIKDEVVPLTWPGPSTVLFEMLGLLIEAGKEVASIKDVITGDTGNKTMPVGTTLALIEQGMAQFTAAYKRIFRSLKHEFKLIAKLNAQYVTPEEYNAFLDPQPMIGPDGQPVMDPMTGQPVVEPFDPAADYNLADMDIKPVADPSSVTRMQEMGKAQFLKEMATEGLVNPQAASMRVLKAANIEDVEELAPQPDPMQQQMAQIQMQLLAAQAREAEAKAMLAEAQAQSIGMTEGIKAQSEQVKAQATVMKGQSEQVKAQAAIAKGQTDIELAKLKLAQEQAKGEASALEVEQTARENEKITAETEKIYWEMGQRERELDLQAQGQAVDASLAVQDGQRAERQMQSDEALKREQMQQDSRREDKALAFQRDNAKAERISREKQAAMKPKPVAK